MDLASCCIGVFVCVGVSCCVFCYKKKRYKFILLAVRNVGLVTLDYYLFHHYIKRIVSRRDCQQVLVVHESGDIVSDIGQCTLPDVITKLSSIPFTHNINVNPDFAPVVNAPRRVPVAIKQRLKEELVRMEESGVIEKVDEPTDWVNSIVVVGKPAVKIRVCLDP